LVRREPEVVVVGVSKVNLVREFLVKGTMLEKNALLLGLSCKFTPKGRSFGCRAIEVMECAKVLETCICAVVSSGVFEKKSPGAIRGVPVTSCCSSLLLIVCCACDL
jgi:hypothetical protein